MSQKESEVVKDIAKNVDLDMARDTLERNEPCTITVTRAFKTQKPCFEMIGSIKWNTKVKGMDMPTILGERSKVATWFWWKLIASRVSSTNEARFKPEGPRKAQDAQKVTKAYKELREANLVVRLRRGVYLINPNAYIPGGENYPIVNEQWLIKTT